MSEDEKMHVSISGKAVYKAVKNLLQNDGEFKQQVSEKMAEQLHDVNIIKVLVEQSVSNLLQDPKMQAAIDEAVKESIDKQLPKVFKEKLDKVMQNSLMDVYRKLVEKSK